MASDVTLPSSNERTGRNFVSESVRRCARRLRRSAKARGRAEANEGRRSEILLASLSRALLPTLASSWRARRNMAGMPDDGDGLVPDQRPPLGEADSLNTENEGGHSLLFSLRSLCSILPSVHVK
ncbi:uncharacterized protein LOC119377251 [Rhipicephalus sanguineus]|uniref:uncharacterized protein LOC119377251 n=1 Tax=Rhipicephalus sanguineus TaxID=34632 RepID=UPI00189300C5|nr:uncharacterized protein LOC119377251 [Rhipicephalus sanguineus]